MNTVADVRKTTEQKMHKSLDAMKTDLANVRTGRAHTGLLDHITVDYYGTPMPIPKVANVSLLDARTLGVSPWEKKMLGVIEKAIRESDLGLNPATQGDVVRVPMPSLTEERRRELLKSKAVSEDEERRAQEDIQKITDKHIADIDKMIAGKEAELMAI